MAGAQADGTDVVVVAATEAVEYVAVDVETTGLSASFDRVVELGAVRFDGSAKELGRFQQLVNPERHIPAAATAVHGIRDTDVACAPLAREALPAFLEFLGDPAGTRLLAHNARFDAGFLGREMARAGLPLPRHTMFDTLALARVIRPGTCNHRLATLAAHLGLDNTGAHRALADSVRVMGLWLAFEGHRRPRSGLAAYKIFDPLAPKESPEDLEFVTQAIARGSSVRVEYLSEKRTTTLRELTPLRIRRTEARTYVVALCHIDRIEKSFRLDRMHRLELVELNAVDATCQ